MVDLYTEVQNALKKIGHAELCFRADEVDMLKDLVRFLKEFETLTELVIASGPNLSVVSLMELKIRKICKLRSTDDCFLPRNQLLKLPVTYSCVHLFTRY